jgi:hypothetical protein
MLRQASALSKQTKPITQMKTDPYNGWTNYETWNANLWLTNDEGSYNYCVDTAQECYDKAEEDQSFSREEKAAFALAEILKELFEEQVEERVSSGETGSWILDALYGYISEVNWHEIATSLIEDNIETK